MTSPLVQEDYFAQPWDHSIGGVFEAPTVDPRGPIVFVASASAATARSNSILGLIQARLSSLHSLTDGWSGPESIAPSAEALDRFQLFLGRLVAGGDVNLLRAEPVPNTEGAIEIEWKVDGAERVIEFTAEGFWLFESRGGEVWEMTLRGDEVDRALRFFNGESL